MDIVQKIQEQIAHHRAELLKLESALEVIASVGDKAAAKAAQAPLITIRRTGAPQLEHAPASKKKTPPKNTSGKSKAVAMEANAMVAQKILRALKAEGPANSGQLAERLGVGPTHEDRNPIYQRLYSLRQRGLIERDAAHVYSLTEKGEVNAGELLQAAA